MCVCVFFSSEQTDNVGWFAGFILLCTIWLSYKLIHINAIQFVRSIGAIVNAITNHCHWYAFMCYIFTFEFAGLASCSSWIVAWARLYREIGQSEPNWPSAAEDHLFTFFSFFIFYRSVFQFIVHMSCKMGDVIRILSGVERLFFFCVCKFWFVIFPNGIMFIVQTKQKKNRKK